MPKAKKASQRGGKSKIYAVPSVSKKKDFGVPRFARAAAANVRPTSTSALSALASQSLSNAESSSSIQITSMAPIDASLTTRDSSTKAFMRELRKVIERSDVIIQVLDARDPEGTRSRWVEEEVRKREADGKKLLGVVNKIDLVPRANLEAWLKHLKHYFPCMPFKSSTQSQRHHLSQNAVPVTQNAKPGEKVQLAELPVTSSSLGAPALLHLLKQYALSTPHSSLTVGVVGYPNVGKSSLINSLKRSRACAVAAMPGKTRVTQEVILDKGVKIIDCPGVVLADMGMTLNGEEGRQKQAEIMLRNCIKAELVEDPIAPVEVILNKTDPGLLMKLYNVPPFADVREFLIRIALVRGRLGKGGIPDLEGSAVSVLRDWNSGKIPYYTSPPSIHPTALLAQKATPLSNTDDAAMDGVAPGPKAGGDMVLNQLSEAFTLDGLLDFGVGGEGEFEENGDQELAFDDEDAADELAAAPHQQLQSSTFPAMASFDSDESDADHSDAESDDFGFRPRPAAITPSTLSVAPSTYAPSFSTTARTTADPNRMFTSEELSSLPASIRDARSKAAAKKAKKKRQEAERTGVTLAEGLLGMGVDERLGNAEDIRFQGEEWQDRARLSKKERKMKAKRNAKERERLQRERELMAEHQQRAGMEGDIDMDGDEGMRGAEEQKKEQEFARFLANVAADSDEEL